jgi:hypothetical protein
LDIQKISMTLEVYAHAMPDMQHDAARSLMAFVRPLTIGLEACEGTRLDHLLKAIHWGGAGLRHGRTTNILSVRRRLLADLIARFRF